MLGERWEYFVSAPVTKHILLSPKADRRKVAQSFKLILNGYSHDINWPSIMGSRS